MVEGVLPVYAKSVIIDFVVNPNVFSLVFPALSFAITLKVYAVFFFFFVYWYVLPV